MAEDKQQKTEPATTRRREEARKKGQVARSMEVNSAIILLAIVLILKIYANYFFSQISSFTKWIFGNLFFFNFDLAGLFSFGFLIAVFLAKVLLPIFIVSIVIGLIVNFLQVGFILSITPLTPNLEKLNPITGFGRIFSLRSLMELLKALTKIFIVSYVGYFTIQENLIYIVKLGDMDIRQAAALVVLFSYKIALRIALILVFLAFVDYLYQKFEFEKSIKMSKQEVKDEYKQLEGDPLLRSRIRQRQQEIARRRMMQAVEKADVVITNPIHVAVAIKYDKKTMRAPLVVGKGARLVAERIKEIASKNFIPIEENPPLAQALYKSCDVGSEIPQELYQAVAEVLAFVYTINKKKVSA